MTLREFLLERNKYDDFLAGIGAMACGVLAVAIMAYIVLRAPWGW